MIAVDKIGIESRGTDEGLVDAILDASRECVLLVGRGTKIVSANAAAIEAFGRGVKSIQDRRLTEIIRDVALHGAILSALNEASTSELRIELIGAETRIYDVRVAPLKLHGERHALAVFYDNTRIEKLERVRQEFLSNISHELRTPLTSILAFVETLEDGAIDDKENNKHFLNVIRRNAERMHALVSDILELSLIESGAVSIEKRNVSISRIVDEVFASLSSKAEERNVSLENRVPQEMTVLADPARLEQMLTNLIDNAVKFNRQDGSVIAEAVIENGSTMIMVKDTGEGILPEHKHRIFERFFRADRSRTREVGGTGLGLAIVKHLARLHGGEVTVESHLSEGTVFTIEFPAK